MAVYKENGAWKAQYSYKDTNGKYRRKVKRGFKTKKEAEAWIAQFEINHGKPTLQKGTMILFHDYFREYAEERFASGYKQSTQEAWNAVEKHVVDVYFKGLTLSEIDRRTYQHFLNDYSKGKKKRSVVKRHQIIKQVLLQAFHEGLIDSDPTYGVHISGLESKSSDEKFIQIDELNALLNYIESDESLITWRTSFMVYLVALSGIRAGEALALTTDDVDPINKTITINKTKQRSGLSTPPKTKTSIRTIVMPQRFFNAYEKFINAKETLNDNRELFDGRKYATITNNWLERIERELNFENIVSIHGLRHSHVSYLLSKGIDITYASKRLGHANVTITQEIYAHLLREKQETEEQKTLNILDEIQ